MAVIKPFRGFRFNPLVVGKVENALAPLWEVLSEEERTKLYRNPNNIIHLSIPPAVAQAQTTLEEWKRNAVVVQDPEPCIYPYIQRYSIFGSPQQYERKGFIALVALNQSGGKHQIIAHEHTLIEGRAQRLALLEALQTQITPVHALYHDPEQLVEPIITRALQHPYSNCVDVQGVQNLAGRIEDHETIQYFVDVLRDKPIYIADGHHRLETSELYRDLCLSRNNGQAPQYILMYLSNYATDDLRILPTHRLVRLPKEFSAAFFWQQLSPYFEILPFDKRTPIHEQLKSRPHSLGIFLKGEPKLITLKPDLDVSDLIPLKLPNSVKRLDYTLLHYLIIDQLLGIPYEEQASCEKIAYSKDYSTIIQQVEDIQPGETAYMAVILREISIHDMLAVCNDGAKMPQKSTYFFPKVISGLVLASIHEH
jgi:uncharacterized protein (DUF1015 family)